jgi:hypothetical protein
MKQPNFRSNTQDQFKDIIETIFRSLFPHLHYVPDISYYNDTNKGFGHAFKISGKHFEGLWEAVIEKLKVANCGPERKWVLASRWNAEKNTYSYTNGIRSVQ